MIFFIATGPFYTYQAISLSLNHNFYQLFHSTIRCVEDSMLHKFICFSINPIKEDVCMEHALLIEFESNKSSVC